jgi:hypothetical protein
VLDSLFASWSDVDYAQDYRLPPDWLVRGVPSPEKLLPCVHVLVYIIDGTADVLTHVGHAYRLCDVANGPKRLWVNDSGHAWSAWTFAVCYRARVLDFLGTALSQGRAGSGLPLTRKRISAKMVSAIIRTPRLLAVERQTRCLSAEWQLKVVRAPGAGCGLMAIDHTLRRLTLEDTHCC